MRVFLVIVLAAAVSAQFPGFQMPLGQMPFGQMPFGQMPFGQMPFGQMPQFGQAFGQPFGQLLYPGQQTATPKASANTLAPVAAQAAPAPAPAAFVAPQAAPAKQAPVMAQISEMSKWAEMMGMPKLSAEDMTRIAGMQETMMTKLQSLPPTDVSRMREDQNNLADQMDGLIGKMDAQGIETFQSRQEQLMNSWAAKLGLPPVSVEEHSLMRSQIHTMFDQLSKMPQADLEQLRAKHGQIKAMMSSANAAAASSASTNSASN